MNKSIIRVEQPDIQLGNDENEPMLEDEPMIPATPEAEQPVQKKKMVLSFEEYRNLSNMIVVHMRREEARVEDEGE